MIATPVLSDDQIADFKRDGYVVVPNAFDQKDMVTIKKWAGEVERLPEEPGRHWVFHEKSRLNDNDLINRIEYISPFHDGFAQQVAHGALAVLGQMDPADRRSGFAGLDPDSPQRIETRRDHRVPHVADDVRVARRPGHVAVGRNPGSLRTRGGCAAICGRSSRRTSRRGGPGVSTRPRARPWSPTARRPHRRRRTAARPPRRPTATRSGCPASASLARGRVSCCRPAARRRCDGCRPPVLHRAQGQIGQADGEAHQGRAPGSRDHPPQDADQQRHGEHGIDDADDVQGHAGGRGTATAGTCRSSCRTSSSPCVAAADRRGQEHELPLPPPLGDK